MVAMLLVAGCGKEVRYDLPPLATQASAPTSLAPTPTLTKRLTVTTVRRAPRTTLEGGSSTSVRTGVTARATTATTDAKTKWTAVTANLAGLKSECGTLSYVWARPDRDSVIAGVAAQGLWQSDNDAAAWSPIGKGAGSALIGNRASAFLIDPAAPDTYWETGIYGSVGAYVTVDNGVTFRGLGSVPPSDQLAVDFASPTRSTMVSVTHETLDLQRTTDGGRTWANIAIGVPGAAGLSRAVALIDARTYLFGTFRGAESGIFRTSDAGATWTRVYTGAVAGPPLVRKDGSIYWVLEASAGVVKTDDKGVTWTKVTKPGVVSPLAQTLVELPDGRLATFSRTIIISPDGGATWRAFGPGLPNAPSGLTYAPVRKAFYLWRFECGAGELAVLDSAILRLPFDPATQ